MYWKERIALLTPSKRSHTNQEKTVLKFAFFDDRHPYWVAALLFITTLVAFLVSGTVVTVLKWPAWGLHLIAFPLLGVSATALLTAKDWWREAGFRAPHDRRSLWLFWLPFVPFLVNLLAGGIQVTDPVRLLRFVVLALLTAFVEETLFRGLVLRVLLPTGVLRAALISASLFGGLHALNALSTSSLARALLQVSYATAIGFGYAALVIRTGTIWPLILAHFATNLAGFVAAGGLGLAGAVADREILFAVLYTVVFSAYGVYLLLGHPEREVAPAQPWENWQ
jgi:membrane protease YdiL (CAAX protease family)